MAKVSIIVPVYNAEKYLGEMIESVLKQTYSDFELLLINDRSTDRSKEICVEYSKKDDRIVFLENNTNCHGPGPTRNIGLDHATGDYLYFMDADDWIEKDMLADTVTLAVQTGADLVPFGYVIDDREKQIRKPLKPCGNFEYPDFKRIGNEIVRGTWSPCMELIKADVVRNTRQNQYNTGEDICFQMDLLCNVKKVCGIDREYYHYRMVAGSVTHSGRWDYHFEDIALAIWNGERKFLEYCGLDEDSQTMKNTAIERYTGCIYRLCSPTCPLPFSEKRKLMKRLEHQMQIRKMKRGFDCTEFSGMRRIAKLLVKYNLEGVMLLGGTLYFRTCGK